MKLKLVLLLLAMLVIAGCNQDILQGGELLYKNPEELEGQWQQNKYPKDAEFILITEDNLLNLQEELRGIKGLSFKDQLGIYVSLGEQATGGYGIKIKQIRKQDDKLAVVVKAVSPAATDIVTQVITHPYDIVKIPLSEVKGIKKVIFVSEEGKKIIEKSL
ncbi:protease stability complex PrcB-like protein [Orenia metallireducens]|jgi:hypothetical protein|uniref:PrcB C-terminal n=1 Tax=Orenia metallireducens TaxID=1413210 RepID=A0A285F499_9FIRM|nr:protease complex subunit PrcB family protein [Orenia metallireducens]PRX34899.1 protease stability complex PrcB-like protein [Orenia metallireducens]SNY06108.1 PrcB C-terminal [Orenia metallireducens]